MIIGDKPVDPAAKYTLASDEYHLMEQGGGFSMFSEEDVVSDVMVDNEAVMKYIEERLWEASSERNMQTRMAVEG